MRTTCVICGEDFEYEPYENWEDDYKDLESMKRDHTFICGECE